MIQSKDTNLWDQVEEAYEYIRAKTNTMPAIGIIFGTGLGLLAKKIKAEIVLPYEEIPYFPVSTVEYHKGELIIGELSGTPIVAMLGRMHYYEGYSMHQITFPVRVMKFLGINKMIVSNAAGSLNPNMPKGSLMIIEDHINLIGDNPLRGLTDESFGPRFVDMSEPYSKTIIKLVEEIAIDQKIKISKGVYAAMTGPSLETRAEYRFLRTIGADAIGMSTIPETIVARQMGISVLGLSVLTDECYPDSLQPALIEDIIKTASATEPDLTRLIELVIGNL